MTAVGEFTQTIEPSYARGLYTTKLVDVEIKDKDGKIIFARYGVTAPKNWRQFDLNQVVQKYLHPKDENDILKMINRVTSTIALYGFQHDYFNTIYEAQNFADKLFRLVFEQKAAWNSPVWFNVGIQEKPQCWACLILKVDDSMHGEEGILNWLTMEMECFIGGSGVGANISHLRAENEPLSGGKGNSSGPMAFMNIANHGAGGIKSGGRTRRAAKMVIMNVDHPDIEEFITCKAHAEDIAQVLLDNGFDIGMNGKDSFVIPWQNANNSVRVPDEFMQTVVDNGEWTLRGITTDMDKVVSARDLWEKITYAAWRCADPGLQFDTTINSWHTIPGRGRIDSSNPCSEYMSVDDTVCNLASMNPPMYLSVGGDIDVNEFSSDCQTMLFSQDILVDMSSYIKESVEQNAHDMRQLGLGYTNMGALLMSQALPYSSIEGRELAAVVTYILEASAALSSARIAERMGPYKWWEENREAHTQVLIRHSTEPLVYAAKYVSLWDQGRALWQDALEKTALYGQRNSQLSVIAPAGTISFLMGALTTGIEPVFAWDVDKTFVGGGVTSVGISIYDTVVRSALSRLAGQKFPVPIGDVDLLWEEYRDNPVFYTAMEGLTYRDHIDMMAAVQPSVCGAISKTVNLPREATVEDVSDAYMYAWASGVKAIAIYRYGSKAFQPLNTPNTTTSTTENIEVTMDSIKQDEVAAIAQRVDRRRKMPGTRPAVVHKFKIEDQSFYIIAGFYDDGTLGEIFIEGSVDGGFIAGMLDSFATAISIGLQYGVPLEVFTHKFIHRGFVPSGTVISNSEIRMCSSIVDYIFSWLNTDEVTGKVRPITFNDVGPVTNLIIDGVSVGKVAGNITMKVGEPLKVGSDNGALEPCPECGKISLKWGGGCRKCINCGYDEGCM